MAFWRAVKPFLNRPKGVHGLGRNSRHLSLFFIVSILLLFVTKVFAQGENKDSLLNLHNTGVAIDSTYNDLIWSYVFNQPDSAIFFAKRGFEWCKENDRPQLLASMNNRIGVAYDIRSMSDSALYHYGIAAHLAKASGNMKTYAGALNNIGLIYWNQGILEKAVEQYILSAGIFDSLGDQRGLSNNYNNIALIRYDNNEKESSREYHHRALSIRKQIKYEYGIGASYLNLAQLYSTAGELNDLDSALRYTRLAIKVKQPLNDQFGLARAYHNLADIQLEQGNADSSFANFSKALQIQKRIENAEGYASSYYNLSVVYEQLGDPENELLYLDSAETVALANDDRTLLWKIYLGKAELYQAKNDFEKSAHYWSLYGPLKHEMLNAERSELVAEMETRYETAIKDKQIGEQRAAIAEAEVKVANRNVLLIILSSVGGILSLLILLYFQNKQKKLQAEKDAAVIAERDSGLKAVISATESERQRIAKDLHDGVVQSLTGVRLRLAEQSRKSTDAESSKLKTLTSDLDDSIGEIREISHRMMPRALSEMGMIPAIHDMLEKSLGATEITFEFEHHNVDDQRFDTRIEVSIYRICQELVNNIIKHSEAKAVSVQLLASKSHLILVVEDNGKGFEFEEQKNTNGIGLMNITTRAQAVNGEVNYQPSSKQGTVATVRVPLQLA